MLQAPLTSTNCIEYYLTQYMPEKKCYIVGDHTDANKLLMEPKNEKSGNEEAKQIR